MGRGYGAVRTLREGGYADMAGGEIDIGFSTGASDEAMGAWWIENGYWLRFPHGHLFLFHPQPKPNNTWPPS